MGIALACLSTAPAHACSKSSFNAVAAPSSAYLLARVGSATVRTGAGRVEFRVPPGLSGAAMGREIHGVVLDVERVAGPARAQLPAGTQRVIAVPWAYSPDCTPLTFGPPARWLEAGARGVFSTNLRPSTDWVDGVPVVDVFSPLNQPYAPGLRLPLRQDVQPVETSLSLGELMDVLDLLPTFDDLKRDPAAATRGVFAWVRADSLRARQAPTNGIASTLRFHVAYFALRALRPPIAGTYRLTLSVDSRELVTVHARTEPAPNGGHFYTRPVLVGEPPVMPPYELYSVLAHVSTAPDSLPTGCVPGFPRGQAYIMMASAPPRATPAGSEYAVDAELALFERASSDGSVLHELVKASFESSYQRYNRKEPILLHGAIVIDAAGRATLNQAETLLDGRRVTVTGERVSTATVNCER